MTYRDDDRVHPADAATPDANGNRSVGEAYRAFLNHPSNVQAWGRKTVKRWETQAMGETPRERQAREAREREAEAVREQARRKRARKAERRKAMAAAKRDAKARRGVVSKSRRQRVYERDGFRCVECGAHKDDLPEGPQGLTLDHVIPVSRGGRNTDDNLQAMCGPCNTAKADTVASADLAVNQLLVAKSQLDRRLAGLGRYPVATEAKERLMFEARAEIGEIDKQLRLLGWGA